MDVFRGLVQNRPAQTKHDVERNSKCFYSYWEDFTENVWELSFSVGWIDADRQASHINGHVMQVTVARVQPCLSTLVAWRYAKLSLLNGEDLHA